MKSNKKQTVSSSGVSQESTQRDNRQEAAFLASEGREQDRTRVNEDRLDRLDEAQFQMTSTMSRMQRRFLSDLETARREIQAKADEKLEIATGKFNEQVTNLARDLDKKVLEARNKIIEPLAIFVGLFTFVSIGFQIFAQVKEYILWMPILGAVLGAIIIFAGLIIHASSVSGDVSTRRWYTGAIIALGAAIFIGSGVYYYKAVEVLRVEDSNQCVVVKAEQEDDKDELYCKVVR